MMNESNETRQCIPPEIQQAIPPMQGVYNWLKFSLGLEPTPPRRNATKYERIFFTLIILVLMSALIAWGFTVDIQMRKKAENNLNLIHKLSIELERLKQNRGIITKTIDGKSFHAQDTVLRRSTEPFRESTIRRSTEPLRDRTILRSTESPRDSTILKKTIGSLLTTAITRKALKSKVMIEVNGNDLLQKMNKETPISHWRKAPKIKTGNISFNEGRYILIAEEGFYLVYAQMLFDHNSKIPEKDFILDFSIMKRHTTTIASVAQPLKSCNPKCTGTVSRIVKLVPGDFLSIQTKANGQTFRMMKSHSFFGAYKLEF